MHNSLCLQFQTAQQVLGSMLHGVNGLHRRMWLVSPLKTRGSLLAHFSPLSSPSTFKSPVFCESKLKTPPSPCSPSILLFSSPCYHFVTVDIPAAFPWLWLAFVCGFRADVGQCHPVFQADVNYGVFSGEGGMGRCGEGG